jgi:hypothetical protein
MGAAFSTEYEQKLSHYPESCKLDGGEYAPAVPIATP